jgi:hypothetical protein
MFLSYMSTIQVPPFPIRWVSWSRFPILHRYYEGTKTAFVLLVAFGFPRLRYRCAVALFLRPGWQQAPQNARTVVHRSALNRSFARRREALPSSHGNLMYICPALRPRPSCKRLTLVAPPHYCSPYIDLESSSKKYHFVARSHGFCTPCLRFVPTSRSTTQDSVLAAG